MCRKLRLQLSSIIAVVPGVFFFREMSGAAPLLKSSGKERNRPRVRSGLFIGAENVWPRQTNYITADGHKFERGASSR